MNTKSLKLDNHLVLMIKCLPLNDFFDRHHGEIETDKKVILILMTHIHRHFRIHLQAPRSFLPDAFKPHRTCRPANNIQYT